MSVNTHHAHSPSIRATAIVDASRRAASRAIAATSRESRFPSASDMPRWTTVDDAVTALAESRGDDGARVALVDVARACDAVARDASDAANARRGRALLAIAARARETRRGRRAEDAAGDARRDAEALARDARASGASEAAIDAIEACARSARAWEEAAAAREDAARARRTARERASAKARERDAEDALGTMNLGEAARAASAANVILRGEAEEEDAESDDDRGVDDEARATCERVVERVRRVVDEEVSASVVFEGSSRVSIDAARLRRACERLAEISADETRLRTSIVARALVDEFLAPMIRAGAKSVVKVVEEDGGDSLRYETATTKSVDDDSAQASLETALRWIRSKLPSEDVAKAVGVEAWGDIAKTCVNAWLSARPSERAIDRTCAVEVVASNCGFVPPPSDGAASYAGGALGPLEAEALATEMREAETRRAAVLARARELALSDDQTIVRTLGDAKTRGVGRGTGEETETSKGANNLLDGAPRTVSKATDLLAAHVDDVLQSATELDPHAHRASASLAAAAADCLDLFRACVIAARGEQLKTIHAASLVFYNDCHHLANRFSASVFARGVALERQIGRTPALIWPVEPLRALGDATRAEANNRALRELHAALDVASGFLRSAEVQVKEDIVKSIARARHVIHRVGTTSMYVLPDPIGTQDAAELALHYARRVTLEILSMEDISVEESEALTEIIGVAFASEGLVGKKGDEDAIRALLRAVGPEWQKVRELGVMLSAPLRDIATSWERGSLQKVGFTASEVRGFIGALFSETPLRAECLARIG